MGPTVFLFCGCQSDANLIPKDDVIVKDELKLDSNSYIKEEEVPGFSCKINDGISCKMMWAREDHYSADVAISLYNESDSTIVLDNNSISVELLEYIPYDEIHIYDEAGGFGPGDWYEAVKYRIDLKNEQKIQNAYHVFDDEEKGRNDAYLKLHGHDVQRLDLSVLPEEKGYYRFRLIINYDQAGNTKTYKTQEYNLVCMEGLNDTNEPDEQIQPESDNTPDMTVHDADISFSGMENDWRNAYRLFVMNEEYLNNSEGFFSDIIDDTDLFYSLQFSLFDMDHNNVPELFIYYGVSMANSCYYVYTYVSDKDKVVFLGNLGFRDGIMIYAPDSAYDGVYYKAGNRLGYDGSYYTLEDEHIIEEYVLIATFVSPDEADIEQVTEDDHLFNTFVKWDGVDNSEAVGLKYIVESEKDEILSMGWDNFLHQYGY